jgi:hypothetical protein
MSAEIRRKIAQNGREIRILKSQKREKWQEKQKFHFLKTLIFNKMSAEIRRKISILKSQKKRKVARKQEIQF